MSYAEIAEKIYRDTCFSRVKVAELLESRTIEIMQSRAVGFDTAEKILAGEFNDRTEGIGRDAVKAYVREITKGEENGL